MSKLNRRTLFAGSAAAAALTAGRDALNAAVAATPATDFEPRGTIGRHERLPLLDLESQQDLLEGFRVWVNTNANARAEAQVAAVLRARGIDPDADLPLAEILKLLGNDPIVTFHPAAWLRVQQLMWSTLQDHFHSNADTYLSEMEAADKRGPGSLELNPRMHIPDYTKREIHMQPGGYVGDPFAGHIYHHGTNQFFNGNNYQDETHAARAASVRIPPDRKVRRVLELGTGIGQLPMELKRRFPEAEVWGIDVGGPMVRYAHMRANELGLDVNFAQRLAEQSGFPDNYFDVVTSMQFFHEVRAEETLQIIKEVHRILRPGGAFYPLDGNPATRRKSAVNTFRQFWIYRWNHEDWAMDWASVNFTAELTKAGFKVDPTTGLNGDNVLAIKA